MVKINEIICQFEESAVVGADDADAAGGILGHQFLDDGGVAVIRAGCHFPLFACDTLDQRDAVAEGSIGIGLEEPVDGCKDDGQIGADHAAEVGSEGIVIAEFEFVDGYGVIFIDHGEDISGEESFDTVHGIEMAFSGPEVIGSDQELSGAEPVFETFLFVKGHEFDLSHSGKGLNIREVMWAFFQSEQFHTHTDGAGRNENDLSAGLSDGGDLSDQAWDGLRIGKQSGPGFNDNAMTIFNKFFSDIISHSSNRLLYIIL
jgi:hypothetical protein